ncbi:uracil-DNA glycosylase [Tropicimonas sp. IMCC34011]|uniref:uracil-DNA glycosylase n=1 Tax=Tropicimonas sp. IMCC34011 TaxID=2248759 RepID=UPI000E2609BD|nr:uracil-DNA glycosylase [Tropicimonas sp. IMCC34011]
MDQGLTYEAALAALAWQVELGVDEAISESPIDRYALEEPSAPKPAAAPPTRAEAKAEAPPAPFVQPEVDPVQAARDTAAAASDLDALRGALEAFELCDLKKGARHTVFSDGHAAARIMVIGEAPGREEDEAGRPFVGKAGRLLDRMFAAIGRSRETDGPDGLYITNILPWRPPQNRDPDAGEIAMMVPFVKRHVELADPDVIVLAGNIACHALMGRRGVSRLRGRWTEVEGRPALPMFHPAYLLRTPEAKREAWSDLLSLQARLRG